MPTLRSVLSDPAPVERTRTISFVAASTVLAAHAVPAVTSRSSAGWTAAALLAIVALLGLVTSLRFHGRTLRLEPVLTPALLTVVSATLGNTVRTMTVCIAVFAVFALHGSQRAWVVRTLLGLAVLPAGAALSGVSGSGGPAWHSSDVLGLVPFVVPVGLVMRNIHRVLEQQRLVSARDALLSTAGGRLLAAQDVDEVHRIGIELTRAMMALAPGLVMLIVRQVDGELRVGRSIGPEMSLVGRPVPAAALDDPAATFADIDPELHNWHVEHLVDRYLVLGARRPIPAAEIDAYRNLVHQVALGETSLRTRAELAHRAHHDYLTQLANRDLFFDRLSAAVERGPAGSVALLSVDLDDFKQVNDTYGHDAGDHLLVEVARRLRTVAGPDGMAARLGGDEFALLLTGLTDEREAERLAHALRDHLIEPVTLPHGTAVVGASIGISGTAAGVTAAELVRRADLAMYAAKASGKNAVRRFALQPAS